MCGVSESDRKPSIMSRPTWRAVASWLKKTSVLKGRRFINEARFTLKSDTNWQFMSFKNFARFVALRLGDTAVSHQVCILCTVKLLCVRSVLFHSKGQSRDNPRYNRIHRNDGR